MAAITKEQMKESAIAEAKMMNEMEGKDEQGDAIFHGEMRDAVERLKGLIPEGAPAMALRGLHLGQAGVTEGKCTDDVYKSFLRWSQKPEDASTGRFNISKAFRRLDTFATFQEKHYEAFFDTPVSFEEMNKICDWMGLKVPNWNLNGGCAVWAIDLEGKSFDRSSMADRDLMRGFWYLMVASLFDSVVQTHGVIIVENLTGVGFSTMLQLQGSFKSIEATINEMYYGCMPFKMKECVLVGSPWWMSALLGVMRLFMSKKMSQRIKNVTQEQMLHHVGGPGMLPKGCCGGTGATEDRYTPGNDPNALLRTDGGAASELAWDEFEKSALLADADSLEGMLNVSEEDMIAFRLQLSQSGVPVWKRSTAGKVQPRVLFVEGGDHSKTGRMIYCADKVGKKSGDKAWPLSEIQDVKRMPAPAGCDGEWLQLAHATRTLELRVEGEEHCNNLVNRLRSYIMAETIGH